MGQGYLHCFWLGRAHESLDKQASTVPALPSALVSSLSKGKIELLFPETRAPTHPRPRLYTGPFVWPLAWEA